MKTTIRFLLIAATLGLGLAACDKKAEQAPAAAVVAKVTAPTDNNTDAWKVYFKQELTPYINGRYRRPFIYFFPIGEDEESLRQYQAQLEALENAVGRGVSSGAMLAFGGADSVRVGNAIEEAFKLAGPKTLKGVRIVAIAKADQKDRMTTAIAPSEAEFIFVEMP